MRKYQKAAVAVAMLGSVSFLGAGVGHAAGGDSKAKADNPQQNQQNQKCSADETNFSIINVGDVNVVVNALGLQFVDQSERKSVECTQAVPAGR
ncbi:hypothetical protein [Streptomyces djakartensis]|uniref:Uncharacterized protein n=1 Tax=Streptomyces djakartensis TaxID=68193 RepID=A0ABQ2ZMW5_9ACTN|nr:hypothetical protein [Streptomyces djakartensis]GGY18151.1 hypothetical protein GCM10010384_25560 [Streptomyces djakartensis]